MCSPFADDDSQRCPSGSYQCFSGQPPVVPPTRQCAACYPGTSGRCQHLLNTVCYDYYPGSVVCPAGTRECPASNGTATLSPSPTTLPSSTDGSGRCSGCVAGTTGTCRQSNGVCWEFFPGTKSCPTGTSACETVTSVSASPLPAVSSMPGADDDSGGGATTDDYALGNSDDYVDKHGGSGSGGSGDDDDDTGTSDDPVTAHGFWGRDVVHHGEMVQYGAHHHLPCDGNVHTVHDYAADGSYGVRISPNGTSPYSNGNLVLRREPCAGLRHTFAFCLPVTLALSPRNGTSSNSTTYTYTNSSNGTDSNTTHVDVYSHHGTVVDVALPQSLWITLPANATILLVNEATLAVNGSDSNTASALATGTVELPPPVSECGCDSVTFTRLPAAVTATGCRPGRYVFVVYLPGVAAPSNIVDGMSTGGGGNGGGSNADGSVMAGRTSSGSWTWLIVLGCLLAAIAALVLAAALRRRRKQHKTVAPVPSELAAAGIVVGGGVVAASGATSHSASSPPPTSPATNNTTVAPLRGADHDAAAGVGAYAGVHEHRAASATAMSVFAAGAAATATGVVVAAEASSGENNHSADRVTTLTASNDDDRTVALAKQQQHHHHHHLPPSGRGSTSRASAGADGMDRLEEALPGAVATSAAAAAAASAIAVVVQQQQQASTRLAPLQVRGAASSSRSNSITTAAAKQRKREAQRSGRAVSRPTSSAASANSGDVEDLEAEALAEPTRSRNSVVDMDVPTPSPTPSTVVRRQVLGAITTEVTAEALPLPLPTPMLSTRHTVYSSANRWTTPEDPFGGHGALVEGHNDDDDDDDNNGYGNAEVVTMPPLSPLAIRSFFFFSCISTE